MEAIRGNVNLRFIVKLFKVIGIWPIGCSKRGFYYTWTFSYHILFTVLYILSMVMNLVVAYRINDLYITLTELAMFGKMVAVLRYEIMWT